VGVEESRQNGKGAIIEARELAGLFLLGERLIVHTAHQFDTALEAFRRILYLIENTPDLDSRVQRVSRSHGEEGVELKGGQRLKFKARTKGGGRGFSGDCVILDEAMILPDAAMGALMPTLSARPNPQLWYLGSAVDKLQHEHGRVFSRIRARGVKGGDPSLAYAEWSATEQDDPDDPEVWARANPGVAAGRISLDHIARERRSMTDRTFKVERLSIGDWFTDEDDVAGAFDLDRWSSLADPQAERGDSPVFAVATAPDRSWSAVAVAWKRSDGTPQVMLADYRPATAWVAPRVEELRNRWRSPVLCDTASRGLVVDAEEPSQAEQAKAHNALSDAVLAGAIHHGNEPAMNTAVRGARWKPSGDTRVLDRKGSTDISPLVAAALAVHGLGATRPSVYESRPLLTL
jgi:phage terminase large subunit-like protein